MRNSKGFSLLETMIALALLTIVTAATATLIAESTKDIRKLERDIEADTESSIAERVMMRDLKSSEPSFNNVIMNDDTGKGFFDFITDSVDRASIENSSRTYTMNGKSAAKKSFAFIVTNESVGGAVIYEPTMAYVIGPEPKSFDDAATLTFQSLNKDGYLQKQSPGYWVDGRILMLDTPVSIRGLKNGVPDYSKPPRSPVFVGVVNLQQSTLVPLGVPGFIDTSHPLHVNKKMTSEDALLRSVPAVGGGAALVRLKVVKALRYSLETTSVPNSYNLVRWSWDSTKWGDEQIVATKVSDAVLYRKAINDPIIYFKINRVEEN
ncbi:type II secretion system protein J [Bdellovibrio sp. HCB337]|uniref:PulJ/GspJ family protein n=1 Tax=Bdellovibrio sp. HCB337 TaxID=3394358 RepID=UPI0039A70F1C